MGNEISQTGHSRMAEWWQKPPLQRPLLQHLQMDQKRLSKPLHSYWYILSTHRLSLKHFNYAEILSYMTIFAETICFGYLQMSYLCRIWYLLHWEPPRWVSGTLHPGCYSAHLSIKIGLHTAGVAPGNFKNCLKFWPGQAHVTVTCPVVKLCWFQAGPLPQVSRYLTYAETHRDVSGPGEQLSNYMPWVCIQAQPWHTAAPQL